MMRLSTKVRANDNIADVFPSDKAVKSEEEKILNPLNKKLNAKIEKPANVI